jgi:signal transduction histidine kinase
MTTNAQRIPALIPRMNGATPTVETRTDHTLASTFRKWWVLVFVVMTAAIGAATVSSATIGSTDKAAAIALCIMLVVIRLTLGRGLVPGAALGRRRTYCIGLIVVLGGLLAVSPLFLYLLYPVVPEFLMIFDRMRPAAIASGVMTLIAVGAQLRWIGWWDQNLPVYGSYLSIAAVAMGFALAMFFGYVLMESRKRAELLVALRASEDALAATHATAGALAERERISQEIHDTVAQGLTSILMLLQGAEAIIESEPQLARGHIDAAQDAARGNLEEIRSIVAALRPAPLAGGSLHDALARVTDGAAQAAGLQATFTVSGVAQSLASAVEVVLLRVTQEAVANVARHAEATTLRVEVNYADGTQLTVSDDGRGFAVDEASQGFGLEGIRRRVAELDGEVAIASAPGEGTRLTVRLP